MPLLTLVIGPTRATALVGLIAVTLAAAILITSWREGDFSAAWRLILASFAGIPLGVWGLIHAPAAIVKGVLGAVLILFGLYKLFTPAVPKITHSSVAYFLGFVAGILGGAYNTNGPPVVIYGTLARWEPEKFRASLQMYFLPSSLMIAVSHGIGGLWNTEIFRLYGMAIVIVLIATYLGGRLNQYFKHALFEKIIYVFLIVIGVLLFGV